MPARKSTQTAPSKQAKSQWRCYSFRAVIEEDAFGDDTKAYHAYLPALQGCRSWGYTPAEALANLQETARLWLESMRERGKPLLEDAEGVEVFQEPRVVVTL